MVADTMRRVDARDERAVPSLAEAVQGPLLKLIEEYSSAMETMRRVLTALGPLATIADLDPAAMPPAPETLQAPSLRATSVSIEVSGGDRQALIEFEDALGQIAGVDRVALNGFSDGRASFAVTLSGLGEDSEAEPGFSVVCAWCGRLLTLGGVRISHGLCPDCAAAASAGHAIKDIPAQAMNVPHDDKMLMFLGRTPRGWVARRGDGAGGWIELKTGCPAQMPAHRVLEQVSAEYPDMLVVISGDTAGAPVTTGARSKSATG